MYFLQSSKVMIHQVEHGPINFIWRNMVIVKNSAKILQIPYCSICSVAILTCSIHIQYHIDLQLCVQPHHWDSRLRTSWLHSGSPHIPGNNCSSSHFLLTHSIYLKADFVNCIVNVATIQLQHCMAVHILIVVAMWDLAWSDLPFEISLIPTHSADTHIYVYAYVYMSTKQMWHDYKPHPF